MKKWPLLGEGGIGPFVIAAGKGKSGHTLISLVITRLYSFFCRFHVSEFGINLVVLLCYTMTFLLKLCYRLQGMLCSFKILDRLIFQYSKQQ